MFYISKIAWLLVQPLSLAFLAVALALLALALKLRRLAGGLAFLSALILFMTLYTTSGNLLLQALEDRIPRPAPEPSDISCIIMLGGGIENEVMSARGGIEFNGAADRYTETLRLALAHPQARILVSGGDGSFSGRYRGEAGAAAEFFSAFGIDPQRLIAENTSRNTWENLLNTRERLDAAGLQGCLLVTSAFHMPRAMALFRKAGLTVTPWPVDYRTSGKVTPGFDFTQPSLNAQNSATAVREWLGLIGYSAAGRIDWPF
ncbi:YdcF family protein [Rhizobium sp. SSA_523]|uniref:YdcF family protein n=1 Tax=Rhizobium sp. SSA_523 TaxID=2952477 RepID=UPI002091D10C|nr:YdcF family protein [Rhizobium sp. SSA_523]MCO5732906.1 YdcF family protein [Rhizobium sp. SSA_523]WKC23478.1 YdcF family protein [Rhizobium sp. SSA_523]